MRSGDFSPAAGRRCSEHCTCSLCRELADFRPPRAGKKSKMAAPQVNENFILRRRVVEAEINECPLMKKSLSCQEISREIERTQNEAIARAEARKFMKSTSNLVSKPLVPIKPQPEHKTVIYFGDSLSKFDNKLTVEVTKEQDLYHARRLCEELKLTRQDSFREKKKPPIDFVQRLKSVLEQKNRVIRKSSEERQKVTSPPPPPPPPPNETEKPAEEKKKKDKGVEVVNNKDNSLPSYIESVINGVISIKIEDNFEAASRIVRAVHKPDSSDSNSASGIEFSSDDDDEARAEDFDWSFVQEWRTRPSGNHRGEFPAFCTPVSISPGTQHIATSNSVIRIQSPAVASPVRVAKEIATRPSPQRLTPQTPEKCLPVYSSDPKSGSPRVPSGGKLSDNPDARCQMRKLAQVLSSGPTKITVQSQPVKAQPAMISSGLTKSNKTKAEQPLTPEKRASPLGQQVAQGQVKAATPAANVALARTHHHDFVRLERVPECHSSSDENRSSGHASMSDTGGHGSSSPGVRNALGPLPEDRLAAGVTNRSTRSRGTANHSRQRHRATPGAGKGPWGAGGLEDIKLAIQQLTMRSQTSTSTYSSLSAGSESSEPVRRLGRYSSLETVNTNVTSADEFVWVDSHNRLVELQHPPWSQSCVVRVVRSGRCRESADRVSAEAIPRLGYLLQRALVRIAREIQRLSSGLGLCAKHEVASAFKIVLCPALADSCIKACLRAAAMFQVPGDGALKQSKSARAGLQLPVGRFHQWMAAARLGRFIHEYAAVYLCAGLENLLEEIILQCLPQDVAAPMTASGLEHSIASSGDLWGLLQPYAHLNAGRIASGALTMPRWASQSSIGSGSGSTSHSGNTPGLEPCLLTTCVGSLAELRDLVARAQQRCQHVTPSQGALRALFYFMRCSQLEHNEVGAAASGASSVQELCYERAYVVLPPLVEWLRVASAHAEYRHAILVDKDDVMQAARLLLPGVDCPPRPIVSDEDLPSKRPGGGGIHMSNQGSLSSSCSSGSMNIEESSECAKRATLALAFKMMLSGRAELLIQALSLVPATTRYDTQNHQGLTALMVAAVRNDETALQTLLDAGADPNIEVPSAGHHNYPAIHPETQHWTAVTFAACRGNLTAVRLLLERGAHVEGGARLSEDKCTVTPVQAAAGVGSLDVVSLLLGHGANAFLSTRLKDPLCFAGAAQRGCYAAISVAAAHGQRALLRKLLSHPLAPGSREVLSLEEMLAEGDGCGGGRLQERGATSRDAAPALSKTQIKSLQEAMYHSAENNHLDITIELRALGVPWTLHCWMHALAAAHELRLDAVIDQLLQDFLQVCPDDFSQQFVFECLPLLFNIFRYSKKEGTTLLLADIFSTCYGRDLIKPIKEPASPPSNGSRIDPKFVNNPELSDVTFRVEGKIFYGHKILLVTASPRLQNMLLSSKVNESNSPPTVQINDIRYNIFEIVMQFLYSGGCNNLEVASTDVLELMAAASFFQLEGLLRYTEARCAEMIDLDNVVAMYIHAKVYSASKLMEFCQGFLLQNMVALLTYDDSVKRLLFAKKIPSHDVLNGLLATLQTRITQRRQTPVSGAAGGGGKSK